MYARDSGSRAVAAAFATASEQIGRGRLAQRLFHQPVRRSINQGRRFLDELMVSSRGEVLELDVDMSQE